MMLSSSGFFLRSFHSGHGIVSDQVLVAEVFKELGNRRELPANGSRCEVFSGKIISPGNDVSSRHFSKLFRLLDAQELHEVS